MPDKQQGKIFNWKHFHLLLEKVRYKKKREVFCTDLQLLDFQV